MAYKEILAVNFNGDRQKQLKILSMFAKAKLHFVSDEEKEKTVGAVLGLADNEVAEIAALAKDVSENEVHGDDSAAESEEVTMETIILLGFDQAELSKTLNAIRRGPLKEIPLKAAVTPNNISWTITKVLGELSKEHAYFKNNTK